MAPRARGLEGVTMRSAAPPARNLVASMRQAPGSQEAPLDDIAANPRNPVARSAEGLDGLVASIRKVGVLQPLLLTPAEEWLRAHPEDAPAVGERPWVAQDGHRRIAAARLAGLDAVPFVLRSTSVDETLVRLHSAGHTRPLTPIEEAAAFRHLIDVKGLTQVQIAEEASVAQSHVSKRLTLLTLPETVQLAVDQGRVQVGDALELASRAPAVQTAVAQSITEQSESVDLRALMRQAQLGGGAADAEDDADWAKRSRAAGAKAHPSAEDIDTAIRARMRQAQASGGAHDAPATEDGADWGKRSRAAAVRRRRALAAAAKAHPSAEDVDTAMLAAMSSGADLRKVAKQAHAIARAARILDASDDFQTWTASGLDGLKGKARQQAVWLLAIAALETVTSKPVWPSPRRTGWGQATRTYYQLLRDTVAYTPDAWEQAQLEEVVP